MDEELPAWVCLRWGEKVFREKRTRFVQKMIHASEEKMHMDKQKVKNYYDQESKNYIGQYQEGYEPYPANLIRIEFLIERLKKNRVKTILDAGCGTCGPMIKLLKKGFDVRGFDFSREMVRHGKKELEKAGYDPGLISLADLEDETNLPSNKFEAILALGVFPHVVDEKKTLATMGKLLHPKGFVFIEFRNDLFSAYTFNKYSLEFFLNRVLELNSLPRKVCDEVIHFYSERLKGDKPVKKKGGKIAYTDIDARFRNPLSIEKELFNPCDFSVEDIHFYHYHALPPIFENKYPKLFRELSLRLEKPDNWRGYLMASAYVVEAKRKK